MSTSGASCKTSCGQNDWPRLIIGVAPSDGQTVALQVETSVGTYAPTEGGCPNEFDSTRMFCSFSVSTSPKDAAVVVHARSNGVSLPSVDVTLGPFNHCAEDIAYVELRSTDDGWKWTTVRYINPCSHLS